MTAAKRSAKETAGGSGKWKERGVPHKGWTCVGWRDLDEPSALCEMCEAVMIRYVHYMEHPDYDEQLGVGCVCSERMSGDCVGPKRRERQLASIARRRRTWLTREWKESSNGNPYINAHGHNVVLYPDRGGWAFRILKKNPLAGMIPGEQSPKWFADRIYPSEEEAKLGAFEKFIAITQPSGD